MRKLTLRLTDEEYAALEQRAIQERRSVREMAERLVTRPPATITPDWTWQPPPWPPLWPPVITSGTTTNPSCPACTRPGSVVAHTCIGTWGSVPSSVAD